MPMAMTALALVVGLASGLAVGAAIAPRTSTQASVSTAPITPPARTHAARPVAAAKAVAPMAAYRQLVANIQAAERRSDFAAQARFASQLSAMLTAQTIGTIYQQHVRLEASLATAKANEEYHAVSMINRRIAALCGTDTVKAQLEFCN
jgi:hypothetical protein